jgi:hypothetical protein
MNVGIDKARNYKLSPKQKGNAILGEFKHTLKTFDFTNVVDKYDLPIRVDTNSLINENLHRVFGAGMHKRTTKHLITFIRGHFPFPPRNYKPQGDQHEILAPDVRGTSRNC